MGTTYKISFPVDSLNNFRKILNNVINDQQTLDKATETVNKTLRNTGSIGSNSILGISSKLEGLGKKLSKFTGNEDFAKPFQAAALQMKLARAQGVGLFGSLKQGIMGFGTVGRATFGSLNKMILIFGAKLAVILAPLAAIAVAFFFLKKAWQNNVGGIQTLWFKTMGRIKEIWAKISVAINKFFQKISPTVKIFVDYLGKVFEMIFATLPGYIATLKAAFMPFWEAIQMIGKALGDAFGGGKKKSVEDFVNMGKKIGEIFTVLGKIMGFVFKIVLQPIVQNIIILISIFKGLWHAIKPIIDAFMEIGKAFDEAFGGNTKKSGEDVFKVAKAIGVVLNGLEKF